MRKITRTNSGRCAPAPAPPPSVRTNPVHDGEKLENLAFQLATVAASPHLNGCLAHLGFVLPLVNLVGTSDGACSAYARELACRALAHLASRREHLTAMREAGVLPVLLTLCDNEPISLTLAALDVLRPLARDPSTKDALRESGAVRLLVKLLHHATSAGISPL